MSKSGKTTKYNYFSGHQKLVSILGEKESRGHGRIFDVWQRYIFAWLSDGDLPRQLPPAQDAIVNEDEERIRDFLASSDDDFSDGDFDAAVTDGDVFEDTNEPDVEISCTAQEEAATRQVEEVPAAAISPRVVSFVEPGAFQY